MVCALPLVAIEFLSVLHTEFLYWVTMTFYVLAAFIGMATLVASFLHGFLHFVIIAGGPWLCLGAFMVNPLIGFAGYVFCAGYWLYFVFVRMRSWAFKGIVAAYLVTLGVTGPILVGAAIFGAFGDWIMDAIAGIRGAAP